MEKCLIDHEQTRFAKWYRQRMYLLPVVCPQAVAVHSETFTMRQKGVSVTISHAAANDNRIVVKCCRVRIASDEK